MAEPGAVKERPVQKVVEGKGRHEARAEPIFGSLAVAVPVAEPALAVELKLTTEEARHLVRAAGPVPALAQVVELERGAEPDPDLERDRAVDLDRGVGQAPATKLPAPSRPHWAGGGPPRHCCERKCQGPLNQGCPRPLSRLALHTP